MDLSSEITNKESFTAIWTIAVDERSNWYCTDLFHGNFAGPAIVDELIRGQQCEEEVRPRFIGCEKGPYERSLRPFLEKAAHEKGIWIPLRFVEGSQAIKPKDERIMGLQPWVESRKIHFLRHCRSRAVAFEEFIRFPKFIRKDCIDALAQLPPLLFPNGAKHFLEEPPAVIPDPYKRGYTMAEVMASLEKKGRNTIGGDRVMDKPIRFAGRA